ncbi:MAG: hypothetical protein H0V53_12950 [Rubrobacter sp.]|nr:hypothetical protein [Rubrobacter sp.]
MQAEIDERLLQEIRKLAEEQGCNERELLDEAIGSYLAERKPGSLKELFEGADRWQRERGIETLSDEESLQLADEELRAARRERKARR